jgi:hypothetical protein
LIVYHSERYGAPAPATTPLTTPARDPAKDLSSEEVKRVKLCSVNDGMVDAADTKNIMVKMDMVL